jgi:hypothetical protein
MTTVIASPADCDMGRERARRPNFWDHLSGLVADDQQLVDG